jgi:hypothetical protein
MGQGIFNVEANVIAKSPFSIILEMKSLRKHGATNNCNLHEIFTIREVPPTKGFRIQTRSDCVIPPLSQRRVAIHSRMPEANGEDTTYDFFLQESFEVTKNLRDHYSPEGDTNAIVVDNRSADPWVSNYPSDKADRR